MRTIVGIKSGNWGSIAVLFNNGDIWYEKLSDIDVSSYLADVATKSNPIAYIEKAWPKMTKTRDAAFYLGASFYECIATCKAYGIEHELVAVRAWHGKLGLLARNRQLGSDNRQKRQSLDLICKDMYPQCEMGIATEALFLLEYGKKMQAEK